MDTEKLERMKAEALVRMKMLHIFPNAVRDFKRKDRRLNKSEGFGGLYWLDDKEKELVQKFEETSGAVVYACILNSLPLGTCLSMLYVPADESLWERDKQDLIDGYPFAWVANINAPDWSEYGTIGIRPQYGGLVRTA